MYMRIFTSPTRQSNPFLQICLPKQSLRCMGPVKQKVSYLGALKYEQQKFVHPNSSLHCHKILLQSICP